MASNKNQHFVPRCYLKPFTKNGAKLSINLFNIDKQLCILDAPVKSQCSGNYFYGQHPDLETAIQSVESAYASALLKVHSPKYELQNAEREVFRIFILMQYLRTEAAARRSVEMFGDMENVIGSETLGFKPSIKEAVQMAMRNFAEYIHRIDDLKVCLVKNHTPVSFITSDDPAVMANRWYLEDARVRHRSPGIASCGVIFFLPLSPRVMCVAYDGDVYSMPNEGGWVAAHKERDVTALNEHQFLNAQANIYFDDWDKRDLITGSYKNVAPRRLPVRRRMTYAVLDQVEGEHKRYRVVQREDASDHDDALIHSEVLMPRPASWPTQLQWRSRGSVYTNGTGAGYFRETETKLRTVGNFWKESSR
jgi:hypothetical protein